MYLYVKTHNKTGLKYLGKTVKKDPHSYPGSGKLWRRHLDKHGYDYSTEILLETDDINELKNSGIYYSNLWNVVESDEWANLVIERGDGGDTSNSLAFKEYVNSRVFPSGESNPFFGKTHSEVTKQKLSEYAKKQWSGIPKSNEHKQKISVSLSGKPLTQDRKNKISESMKGRIPHNKGVVAGKILCVYCNREIGPIGNFNRWHGNNCKENK